MNLVQRNSLPKEVSNLIEIEIRQGLYALKQKLPSEPELMQKYGVGRSTIREAIKYLVQLGYVQVVHGVGTFVTSTTGKGALEDKLQKANFDDMSEVRQLLELKAVEKAALNRSSQQLAIMKDKLALRNQYATEGKIAECFQADIEFHNAVAESCGNELLIDLYKVLSQQLAKLYNTSFPDTAIFIDKNELHEKLVLYIELRSPTKALEVAKKIIASP